MFLKLRLKLLNQSPTLLTKRLLGSPAIIFPIKCVIWNAVGEGGPKLDTVSSWTPLLKVDRIKTKIFKQAYLM